MRGLPVARVIHRLRGRREPDWVRRLPPDKARVLTRNLRLILEPGRLLEEEAARPDPVR